MADTKRKKTESEFLTRPSATDPNGSWTGVPVDEDEEPVQDADDL